jgi:hypothetical protein
MRFKRRLRFGGINTYARAIKRNTRQICAVIGDIVRASVCAFAWQCGKIAVYQTKNTKTSKHTGEKRKTVISKI